MAFLCSLIANVNRNPKKRSRPFRPSDFMSRIQESKPLTSAQIKQRLLTINTILGGEVKSGKK